MGEDSSGRLGQQKDAVSSGFRILGAAHCALHRDELHLSLGMDYQIAIGIVWDFQARSERITGKPEIMPDCGTDLSRIAGNYWDGPPPQAPGGCRGVHRRRSMEIRTIGIDLGK